MFYLTDDLTLRADPWYGKFIQHRKYVILKPFSSEGTIFRGKNNYLQPQWWYRNRFKPLSICVQSQANAIITCFHVPQEHLDHIKTHTQHMHTHTHIHMHARMLVFMVNGDSA